MNRAVLLVGLGYCLGSLYLHSIEAVQNVSLPGRGGRVSASVWVGGMAVILVGYSLFSPRLGRRQKLREI